jgi:hypothetical protein
MNKFWLGKTEASYSVSLGQILKFWLWKVAIRALVENLKMLLRRKMVRCWPARIGGVSSNRFYCLGGPRVSSLGGVLEKSLSRDLDSKL